MLALESTYRSTGVLPSASDKNSGRYVAALRRGDKSATARATSVSGGAFPVSAPGATAPARTERAVVAGLPLETRNP